MLSMKELLSKCLLNPWHREAFAHLFDFVFDALEGSWVVFALDGFVDPFCDLTHFVFLHSAGCHGWSPDADS